MWYTLLTRWKNPLKTEQFWDRTTRETEKQQNSQTAAQKATDAYVNKAVLPGIIFKRTYKINNTQLYSTKNTTELDTKLDNNIHT